MKRKLIEVALPLEAINRESAREKSIRYGHPSTLHLWWARRPLAACRAVLFAQLVDDPSANPAAFPTEEDQAVERRRLFSIIERLVVWENLNDVALLAEAHQEIVKSCAGEPPAVLDPFAGGGSIPLEAQRLGLKAFASDLNPVAVLINRALIEIPPMWAGHQPIFPGAADARLGEWSGTSGLAEDVRRYGAWVRDRAEEAIGRNYPKAILSDGSPATVVAWIWVHTVVCPNPACGIEMPLARSFWLSKKKERPTWVVPEVVSSKVSFRIETGSVGPKPDGTVDRSGASCIGCHTAVPLSYIRGQGRAGAIGSQLMATVAEGDRRRHYLAPTDEQLAASKVAPPLDVPDTDLPIQALGFRVQAYGMVKHRDLFTNRQLAALATFSDLVQSVAKKALQDARVAGLDQESASAYANSVALYLAFAVDKGANLWSMITSWMSDRGAFRETFARQALPMVWDFAEANPLSMGGGGFATMLDKVAMAVEAVPATPLPGSVRQADAATLRLGLQVVVSTDPPYYDNVPYSDLSDFFYAWLRRSLSGLFVDDLQTVLTPKAAELVAEPHRFEGSRDAARKFFEEGLGNAFERMREMQAPDIPITIFYAFKQAEASDDGLVSTGWETMLTGLIKSGLTITATWPVRTEGPGRIRALSSNALASSVVLACRPAEVTATATTRRGFLAGLQAQLPKALRELQQGSVAPVDLDQAAIGPGMAVFTQYARVVEADGSDMSVRTALALINHALDEVRNEQEGDFDADTRFCVSWFRQHGFSSGKSGDADQLARSRNTAIGGLERGGIFKARGGDARLLGPSDLSAEWDPLFDDRISVWEVTVRLAKALSEEGGVRAAELMAAASQRVDIDTSKELAYLLFSVSEKNGWPQEALLFNNLGTSWSDLVSAARSAAMREPAPSQGTLSYEDGSEDGE